MRGSLGLTLGCRGRHRRSSLTLRIWLLLRPDALECSLALVSDQVRLLDHHHHRLGRLEPHRGHPPRSDRHLEISLQATLTLISTDSFTLMSVCCEAPSLRFHMYIFEASEHFTTTRERTDGRLLVTSACRMGRRPKTYYVGYRVSLRYSK